VTGRATSHNKSYKPKKFIYADADLDPASTVNLEKKDWLKTKMECVHICDNYHEIHTFINDIHI